MRDEYIAAVFEVTGGEHWKTIQDSIEHELRSLQVRALQAETWADVCELRGQAKAFVQIYNMRENAKLEKSQDEV